MYLIFQGLTLIFALGFSLCGQESNDFSFAVCFVEGWEVCVTISNKLFSKGRASRRNRIIDVRDLKLKSIFISLCGFVAVVELVPEFLCSHLKTWTRKWERKSRNPNAE